MAAQSGQVDWARLRAFIAVKEAHEQQHGCPAPLSKAEREAIETLIPLPRPRVENSLSDNTNYLGQLYHYAQVSNLSTNDIDFAFDSVTIPKAKGFDVAWTCLCTIPGIATTFPCPGYGMEPGETDPRLFARKQDAKQHAAKGACDYLSQNNLMPGSRLFIRPPTLDSPSTTVSKRPVLPPNAPNAPPVASPVQKNVAQPPPPAKRRQVAPPANNGDDGSNGSSAISSPHNGREERESSAVVQVNALANILRVPLPRYFLTEDPDKPDFWDVRVDFHDPPFFPSNVGSVQGVYTKKAAREKSAETIKVWMEGIRFQRDRAANELLRTKAEREAEVKVS